MIELDILRSAALSDQPWARLDELVRSELTSGRSTRQIFKNIIGIVREIDDTPGLTEDGRDAIGDTLDGLTGMCHRECRYQDPPNLTAPSEDEIAELPRWARVAFAARCARRVLPMFELKIWPTAKYGQIVPLEFGVRFAESGVIEEVPPQALMQTLVTLSDATLNTALKSHSPALDSHQAIGCVGLAVQLRSEIAVRDTHEQIRICFDAVSAAVHSSSSFEITPYIRRDFDHIEKYADWHRWTDDTPVSPDFFGPLWPEGPPKGWPADPDVLQRADLPLELLSRAKVLEQMTEDETVNLFNQINAYYIARTGTRLTMEDLLPMIAAGVLAEV